MWDRSKETVAGEAGPADRAGQRQEDIGLTPRQPGLADALAGVVDAGQVPPGQSRPARRDRLIRGVPGRVTAGHGGGEPGQRGRRRNPLLQVLVQRPGAERVGGQFHDLLRGAHSPRTVPDRPYGHQAVKTARLVRNDGKPIHVELNRFVKYVSHARPTGWRRRKTAERQPRRGSPTTSRTVAAPSAGCRAVTWTSPVAPACVRTNAPPTPP